MTAYEPAVATLQAGRQRPRGATDGGADDYHNGGSQCGARR
jgi:hypothetical protein